MEKEQLIALVRKSQSGDAAAIEKLLTFAHASVSYQCRKMLTNEQDAEDMTQEVLVTIYTKLDTLQEPAAFHKWVNQITASRCINALNRTHVEYQFAEDEEGHSILDTLEELDEQMIPDKAIDNAETVRMIGEIVEGLPDVQRAATLMFYFSEMSVKEIAQAMHVSENTVKSRLNYARKAIKEKVLDYEKQGIKLYGLSPLPYLLYFLRLAARSSADRKAAGIMVAKVMATEGAAVGIAAGVSTAAAAGASATAAGTVATATSGATAAGIFAGISAKVVAGVLAAVVTVGSVAAVVIPNAHADTEDPTAVSAEAVFATETEYGPETEIPITEATMEAATEAATEASTETPTEEATEAPAETPTEAPAEETQPVHQHNYKSETIRTPNCTDMGRVKYTCSCGSSYEEDTPALGHDWGEWYESSFGQPEHQCKTCGLVTGEAMDWDDFISNGSDVSNDNSDICTSCGVGSYTLVDLNTDPCAYRGCVAYQCNHCGYVAGYSYPVLEGHKMVGGVCSVCGFTQDQCEHFYDSGVEYWPAGTMTWDPYTLYTCQWCGHTYQEPIDYLS